MTPHIESELNDISPLVIMPGDPKRAKYIAENYLENVTLINEIREELAFTGFYKGKKVTVFSSGMGIPSMGIYSHELFSIYNVKAIIRIGSAGSYSEYLNVKDLFLTESAYSLSNYSKEYCSKETNIVYSSKKLNDIIKKTAEENNIKLSSGRCYVTESYYSLDDYNKLREEKNCDCVEMESFSLFVNAQYLDRLATTILTISNSFVTSDELSSTVREKGFDTMIYLALESIIKVD